MNILHISKPDSKAAGIAAYNLHFALLRKGFNSQLLVEYDTIYNSKKGVVSYNHKISWIIKKYKRRIKNKFKKKKHTIKHDDKYNAHGLEELNINTSFEKIVNLISIKPDVIFIFFPQGFINTKLIRDIYFYFKVPIYWYLMDMAPITGGCHFSWDCEGYKNNCGTCPAIFSKDPYDITFKNLEFKKNNLIDIDINLIIGSDWLINQAKQSALFKNVPIIKIMLPVDENIFYPKNKIEARNKLDLPINKKIFFFGAQYLPDPRKGIKELLTSFKILFNLPEFKSFKDKIYIIFAGSSPELVKDNLDLENKYLGLLSNNEHLAVAYQASDYFICPSLQDTGPYMLIEAISCGIPVISFNMGLAYEFVKTGETGYKAELGNAEDLAKGIIYLTNLSDQDYFQMSENCVALAERFLQKNKQVELIEGLLNGIK